MEGKRLKQFIKKNFRPLKTKEKAPIMIGRDTYAWVLKQEKKKNFAHLTVAIIDELVEKYELKKADFEDGRTYIVHPRVGRNIMVAYYSEEEESENPIIRTLLKPRLSQRKNAADRAAEPQEGEKYLVSEQALARIFKDFRQEDDSDMAADIAADLTTAEVVDALGRDAVRYHYDEAEVQILAKDEDPGDSPVHPTVFPAALPGTEVSMQQLDASQRTILDGAYRDTATESSHSVEHKITRSE
ncbi:MAG: hypothetical protein ABIH66_08110 [bacterium]